MEDDVAYEQLFEIDLGQAVTVPAQLPLVALERGLLRVGQLHLLEEVGERSGQAPREQPICGSHRHHRAMLASPVFGMVGIVLGVSPGVQQVVALPAERQELLIETRSWLEIRRTIHGQHLRRNADLVGLEDHLEHSEALLLGLQQGSEQLPQLVAHTLLQLVCVPVADGVGEDRPDLVPHRGEQACVKRQAPELRLPKFHNLCETDVPASLDPI
mmetsp:Transcript_96815/g.295955  ORF Transcript_96815/g.295955 Transcript_96815/m.295955 type:complete len:215 (+) Transcript_96815:298-942(+)